MRVALVLVLVLGAALALLGLLRHGADDAGRTAVAPGASEVARPVARPAPPSGVERAEPLAADEPPESGGGRRSVEASRRGERTAAFTGTVVGEFGPLSGAEVSFVGDTEATEPVTTGADGRFLLAVLPSPEEGSLVVRARKHAPLERRLPAPERGEELDVGVLPLKPGITIEGRVVDERDQPVEGAVVSAAGPMARAVGESPALRARTDEAGHFLLVDAPRGRVRLEASAPGHGSRALDLNVPAEDIVLRLAEERRLTITIVDPDGAPVPGAEVRLDPHDVLAVARAGTTDSTGEVRFLGLGCPSWTVVVSADDFRPEHRPDVRASGELEIRLAPWPCIEGRIVTPEGGSPPVGTRVWTVHRTRVPGRMPPMGEGTPVQADGSYRLCNVFPGTYEIVAEAPGFAQTRSQELQVQLEGDVQAGTLALARGGALVLSIDAPGGGIAGTRVELFGSQPSESLRWNPDEHSPFLVAAGSVDESAHVRFDGLEPGPTWVLVRGSTHLPFLGGPYAVADGQVTTPPVLHLELGGHVEGQVSFPDGRPASDASLLMRGGTVSGHVRFDAGPDGRFRSPALPPGTYRVWARAPDAPGAGLGSWEGDVDVAPGQDRSLSIVLE